MPTQDNTTTMTKLSKAKRAPSKSPTESKPMSNKRRTPLKSKGQHFFNDTTHMQDGWQFSDSGNPNDDDFFQSMINQSEGSSSGSEKMENMNAKTPKAMYQEKWPTPRQATSPHKMETSDEENYIPVTDVNTAKEEPKRKRTDSPKEIEVIEIVESIEDDEIAEHKNETKKPAKKKQSVEEKAQSCITSYITSPTTDNPTKKKKKKGSPKPKKVKKRNQKSTQREEEYVDKADKTLDGGKRSNNEKGQNKSIKKKPSTEKSENKKMKNKENKSSNEEEKHNSTANDKTSQGVNWDTNEEQMESPSTLKSALKKDQSKAETKQKKMQPLRIDTDNNDEEEGSVATQKANQYQEGKETTTTQEDCTNTISSDTTTKNQTKEEESLIVEPINVRCQFSFVMKSIDHEKIAQQVQGTEKIDESAFSRIRTPLLEVFQQIKKIDENAKLMKWSDKKEFKTLDSTNDTEFPSDPAELALYFPGLRPKQTSGRVFVRVRIHSPERKENIVSEMVEWARLYSINFNKCVVQTESAEIAGWLLYSSQYMDTDHMASFLQSKTGFEWGLRLGAITNSDKNIAYKDRVKAMILYVPSGMGNQGANQASNYFSSKEYIPEVHGIEERYQFVPPEQKVAGPTGKKMFLQYVERQRAHQQLLKGHFCNLFAKDIDTSIMDKREKIAVSIREMVLNIYTAPDSDFNTPPYLFVSVDFTPDSKRQFFDGRPGPGGPGYIFSFYSKYQGEAIQMIQGLGRYVRSTYSRRIAAKAFTKTHFLGNEGWYWDIDNHKFITPEETRLENNLCKDMNHLIVNSVAQASRESEREALQAKNNNPNEAVGPTDEQVSDKERNNQNQSIPNTTTVTKPGSNQETNTSNTITSQKKTGETNGKTTNAMHQPKEGKLQTAMVLVRNQLDGEDSIIKEKDIEMLRATADRDDDSLDSTTAIVRKDVPHIEYNNRGDSESASAASSLTFGTATGNESISIKETSSKDYSSIVSKDPSTIDSIIGNASSLMGSIATTGKDTVMKMVNSDKSVSKKLSTTQAYFQSQIRRLLAEEKKALIALKKADQTKSIDNTNISNEKIPTMSENYNKEEKIPETNKTTINNKTKSDQQVTREDSDYDSEDEETSSEDETSDDDSSSEDESRLKKQDGNSYDSSEEADDEDESDDKMDEEKAYTEYGSRSDDRDNYNDANDDNKENKEITQKTNPDNTYANKGSQSNKSRCEKQADSFDVSNNK